jgi:uncharacterized protein (DUF2252 family)
MNITYNSIGAAVQWDRWSRDSDRARRTARRHLLTVDLSSRYVAVDNGKAASSDPAISINSIGRKDGRSANTIPMVQGGRRQSNATGEPTTAHLIRFNPSSNQIWHCGRRRRVGRRYWRRPPR